MDEVLWEVTWIDMVLYLAMIPEITGTNSDDIDREIIKPEDELKFIKLGTID